MEDVKCIETERLVEEIDKGGYDNLVLAKELYRRYIFQKLRVAYLSRKLEEEIEKICEKEKVDVSKN